MKISIADSIESFAVNPIGRHWFSSMEFFKKISPYTV